MDLGVVVVDVVVVVVVSYCNSGDGGVGSDGERRKSS